MVVVKPCKPVVYISSRIVNKRMMYENFVVTGYHENESPEVSPLPCGLD